jgi:hypothetical protein
MKKEEYAVLINRDEFIKVLTIDDLENKSDRTLLYGYTCVRNTWHVYVKDKKIISVIYKFKGEPEEMTIHDNYQYLPDKRLYPERCDFEFCILLKAREIDLPFTNWSDEIEPKQYYGKILGE